MSIVVEHEKRRREILEKALDVFMDQGYENVTFLKIADRCGITRTTLYLYFKNKKEVFNYSIKQMLSEVEREIQAVRRDQGLKTGDRLVRMLTGIIDRLEKNRRILLVSLNYLLYISKSDHDPKYRVRRRTVRLRHFLATTVIEGIRAGELIPMNIRDVDELFCSILESAVFRLAVLRQASSAELKGAAELAVRRLEIKPGES
ncbi:MAG: TetR/AcrR family transcriptional regulator [Treponema sp.]|jgi:AcrR family transcriptional regulator|nr:TetR/AcrR family transcriptional regulator [Treponema sp.]